LTIKNNEYPATQNENPANIPILSTRESFEKAFPTSARTLKQNPQLYTTPEEYTETKRQIAKQPRIHFPRPPSFLKCPDCNNPLYPCTITQQKPRSNHVKAEKLNFCPQCRHFKKVN